LEPLPEALLQSSDAFFGAALTQINAPGEARSSGSDASRRGGLE